MAGDIATSCGSREKRCYSKSKKVCWVKKKVNIGKPLGKYCNKVAIAGRRVPGALLKVCEKRHGQLKNT